MNVALYARVSKLNCHQDPEVQLRELRAWAAANGHTVFQEYVDNGVSGSKEHRPAKDEMMKHANHGRFHAIAIWKLDRFARSVRHLVNDVAQLDEWKVSFISLRDNLDFSTAAGRLMFHVIAAMAEFERELARERIKAGLAHAKAKGHAPGPKIGPKGPSRTTLWRRSKKEAQ